MENVRFVLLSLFVFVVFFLYAQDYGKLQSAFQASYALEQKGDYTGAAKELRNVYDEKSYEINLRLGWLTYMAGNFTESVAYYQKAIQIQPMSEEARMGLVLPQAALGNWDAVLKTYEEILKVNPYNTVVLYRVGLIYYGRAQYQKAYSYFEKVVNLYPFSYDGLLMLAWTNLRLGKTREAKVLFTRVLLLSPGDASALEGLEMCK